MRARDIKAGMYVMTGLVPGEAAFPARVLNVTKEGVLVEWIWSEEPAFTDDLRYISPCTVENVSALAQRMTDILTSRTLDPEYRKGGAPSWRRQLAFALEWLAANG
jgi:hypothetical protein